MLDQRLGDRAGAGAKLDHRPLAIRIDIARHRARQHLAGRRDGAHRQRLLDPGADEADFVVEADAVLLFEAAQARLDVTADALLDQAERALHLLLEMLLDEANALLDVLPDDLFEKPDTLFELLEGLHGHRERNRIIAIL